MIAAVIACAVMWALVLAVLVWLWAPRRRKATPSRTSTILPPDDQDAYGRMVPRKPVRERQATPR